MKANEMTSIPKEKFTFVQKDSNIHDQKFDTKPVGYFKDAWYRFSRNKGSVVAACIIVFLLIFAIVVPFFSKYDLSYSDGYYKYALPKSETLSKFGIMTGNSKMTGLNQQLFDYYNSIPDAIVSVDNTYEVTDCGRTSTYYDITIDSYKKVGYVYQLLSESEYEAALAYEEETGIQLLYPLIDTNEINNPTYSEDPNMWYENDAKGAAVYDENGDYQPIYKTDDESEDGYQYALAKQGGAQYQVRVLYYDWYVYQNGHEPIFFFGTDQYGKDILVNLAIGARFSFILGICVSVINFIIGMVYGAIEGYYGGTIDLVMERIMEILSTIPFLVVVVLFQLYFAKTVGVVVTLAFAYLLNGWTGVSSRTRTQFYRYKGQEYVLAARTLGAKDKRLIFRHIFPNALGTIITSAVLMIPSVIFTESTLSYLGVINLQTSNLTSVGTLLSSGNSSMSTYPHVIFFPALFISLLMISFNMFGNGLRDAFNPSLRGAEE